LTEEEKKARLEELREKLKAKRATQSVADKEEQKRNEVYWTLPFHQHALTLHRKSARRPPGSPTT
jgi:hypothetical protein